MRQSREGDDPPVLRRAVGEVLPEGPSDVSPAGGPFPVTAADLAIQVPAGTVVAVSVVDLSGAERPAIEELSAGSWGHVAPDPGRDIAKMATVDPSAGTILVGFAGGLGVQAGAVAVRMGSEGLGTGTEVAAVRPARVVVAGTSDRECAAAANALVDESLSAVVTVGGRVVAREPAAAETVLHDLGCRLASPLRALAAVDPEDLTPPDDGPNAIGPSLP
jgi:hypothetical protein